MKHAIRTVGGDFDWNDKPRVDGVAFFLGIQDDNADVVVNGSAQYYVAGEPQSLAYLMNSTSYGIRNVMVF